MPQIGRLLPYFKRTGVQTASGQTSTVRLERLTLTSSASTLGTVGSYRGGPEVVKSLSENEHVGNVEKAWRESRQEAV